MKHLFLAVLLLLASVSAEGSLWYPLRLSLPGLDHAPTIPYTGRVVDGSTGRPIAGARVWPGVDPEAFVTTDARGVYRLAWRPATPVQLWVRAEGYVPFRKPFRPPTPWIVSPKAPTLAAWPARTLAGTVARPEGRPVRGAEVRIFGRNPAGVEELAKTLTSEQGRFELAVIHDGDYEVIAMSPGLAPASESLTLVEGQAGISGIRLVLRSGRTASGRVVDERGQPVAEARVALTRNGSYRLLLNGSAADNGLYQATTDGDGRFEIPGLPAGWFDLEASRPGFLPERFQALEVDGGSGSADLGTVTLRQPATVTGWVIGQSREPLAGVTVRLKSGGVPGIEVVSGPDGRFELTAPDPRRPFEIEACRPDRWTMAYPYETLPDEPVEITLPPAARLTGRVVDPDGEPAVGASVTATVDPDLSFKPALPSPCLPMAEVEAKTDAEGRFVLAPVPVVELYVWATMPAYLGSGVEIVNFDEDRLEAEVPLLALKRAAAVSGRVLQADGSPVPGAWMTLQGRGGYFLMMAVADGDGRYRIEGLPTGPQTTIYARHDTLGAGERDFEIAPGENQVDITVEPTEPRLARGRVVDPDGQPVAGALVEQGLHTVYTDTRGGFAIPIDEDGYELVARKAGYASAYLSHWAAGGAREGLELRLGREASVSGRLLGFDPADIDETWVSAIFLQFSEMQVLGRVSSDGTYHVQGLSPGEWLISANLGERSAGATVTISPDKPEVEQDLSFPNQAAVRGRVVDADGQPVEGANVRLAGPEKEYQAETETDGAFSLEVEEGTYEILAVQGDHALTRGGVVTVSGEPVEGLEIRLERAAVLTGRLLGLSAEDLEEVQVRIELGSFQSSAAMEIDQESGEPPVYSFDDLGPGDWTVRAWVNAEEIVRKVTVRPDDQTVELDLPFSFGDLTLSGRVTGYRMIPSGGGVWLRNAASGQGAWIEGIAEGTFAFSRLRPGRYVLNFFDDRNQPVLQREVDLTSSQEIEIDLGSL